MTNKDTIIEALTMQLRLEREGNLALAKRNCDNCESLRKAAWDRIKELEDKLLEREWIGLTDEDKEGIKNKATYNWDTTAGEYASEVQALTEAKLKEKNVPQP